MRCALARDYRFESARSLPAVGKDHPCGRVHGHSFKVTVVVEGDVDPELGWVMDFADIDDVCGSIIAALDHRLLDDIEGLANPTSENIAGWIWTRAKGRLPGLSEVVVAETESTRCIFRG